MRKLEEWIDFMESEAEPVQTGRLGLLLKHSIEDQLVFNNLRKLRTLIKESDSTEIINPLLESPRFMMNMHNEIMLKIQESARGSLPQETSSPPQDQTVSPSPYKL